MRGTWAVAGRTRSRRAIAAAAAAEAKGHVKPPSAPAPSSPDPGRRRGRGGAEGAPPKPPDPGHSKPAREVAVIVLDDDGDDDAEGGESVCGGRGAALHVEAPPRGDRAGGGCPLAARTTSSLEPSSYEGGVAVGFVGSSSSSVSSQLRAVETPSGSGSVAECSEVLARSIGGGVVSGSADEARSEATVSVHGGGEDSAELDHCVGGVAGSCGGPSPGNESRELDGVSSGYSPSSHGNSAGVEVESGGSLASGTGTKQEGSQSFNASSEPAPREGRGGAGAETSAKAGATTSNEESGSKPPKHSRGEPGSQDVADSHGGMGNLEGQPRTCVARRTRSKLFGDKYRKIVYTGFFHDSGSSDADGEDVDDSDVEETRLWTPPSSASLLSLSSSSSSESEYESDRSDDGWMKNTKDQVVTGRQLEDDYDADGKPAAKKGRSLCKGNPFPTGGKKGRENDSVSADSPRAARQSHLCFSAKDGKSKQKGPSGKSVPSPADNEWENSIGSDGGNSDEKPEKVRESDADDCFERQKTVTHKMQHRTKKHEAQIGKFKKRKRSLALKNEALFKVFIDKIWGEKDAVANEALSPKDEILSEGRTSVKNKEPLPLVFSFGDEDLKPVEKSEYEKAIDELWGEFDFVLNSNDIGKYEPHECEHEDMDVDEDQNHHSCNNGAHQFVLDEQIGIKCKLCSFVCLEIRYIPPVLATERTEGIFGRPIWGKPDDLPQFDGLFANENEESKGDGFEPSNGTVWDLIPGVRSTLYPHQQEAFEFMWRNLAGDIFLNNLKGSACYEGLGGCVISHAPGTGKSRLTIVFLQAFLKVFQECRHVTVAPRGMLLTWKKEFEKFSFFKLVTKYFNAIPLHSS